MNEVQKPSVIYKDNQGAILPSKNRQIGIRTNHIDINHHFLRNIVEDKDIDIQYIRNKENSAEIMTKNTPEEDFARHMKRITEGELWNIVDNGRENCKNTRVMDDVISHDKD